VPAANAAAEAAGSGAAAPGGVPARAVELAAAPATAPLPAAVPPAVRAAEALPPSPQTLLPALQARWAEIARAALREGQVGLAAALTDSAPVALAGDLLTIELPASFCSQLTIRPDLMQQLEGLLLAVAGRRLRVAGRPRRGQAVDERGDRYRSAQEHPLVQLLLKRFEADIVAREIIDHDDWLHRHQG
jgi:hypothetical protein